MQDTVRYQYLLGLQSLSPWAVWTRTSRGQRVDVCAEHPEDASWGGRPARRHRLSATTPRSGRGGIWTVVSSTRPCMRKFPAWPAHWWHAQISLPRQIPA